MKILVIYKSKTGFAKKYAKIISDKLCADLTDICDVKEDKLKQYDIIIYGAGLYAEKINGLDAIKNMLKNIEDKKFIIFATGASPNERIEKNPKIWEINLTAEEIKKYPHFYMQGGINYENMTAFDRMNMKMFSKMMMHLAKKGKKDKNFAEIISSSHDISDPKFADELIDFVKSM